MTYRTITVITHNETSGKFVATVSERSFSLASCTRLIETLLSAVPSRCQPVTYADVRVQIETLARIIVNNGRSRKSAESVHHKDVLSMSRL